MCPVRVERSRDERSDSDFVKRVRSQPATRTVRERNQSEV
jgi:hypothetical protein